MTDVNSLSPADRAYVDLKRVQRMREMLKDARDEAGNLCPQTLTRIRAAIRSADGAVRNAEARASRLLRAEGKPPL